MQPQYNLLVYENFGIALWTMREIGIYKCHNLLNAQHRIFAHNIDQVFFLTVI